MQVFIVIMVGILQLTPAQLEQIQMCKDIGGTMYNSLESSCFKPSADNPDELTEYTLTETTEETDNAN